MARKNNWVGRIKKRFWESQGKYAEKARQGEIDFGERIETIWDRNHIKRR